MSQKQLKELKEQISQKNSLENELNQFENDIFIKKEELIKNELSAEEITTKITSIERQIPIIQEELKNWIDEIDEIKDDPALADDLKNWQNIALEVEENLKEINSQLESNKKKLKNLNETERKLEQKYSILNQSKFQIDEKINIINQKIEEIDSSLERECLNFPLTKESIELLKKSKQLQNNDFDLFEFLKLAKSCGIEIDASLLELSCEVFTHKSLDSVPDYLLEFISNYFKNREIKEFLEIDAELNSFTVPLSKKMELNATAIVDNDEVRSLLQVIYDNHDIHWQKELSLQKPNFDAIVYNIHSLSDIKSISSDKFELKDYSEYFNILKSAALLKDSGAAIYLLGPDFLLRRKKDNVFCNLHKFGIYINTIINIPLLERIMIILTKKQPKNQFLAELNQESSEIILKNLKTSEKGKIAQYGSFTDIGSFYSFDSYWAKLKSDELGAQTNLKPLSIQEISEEININYEPVFEDKTNSIYFKDADVFLGTISPEKARFYVQIVLKEDYVLAEYLYQFFNTPLGTKIRESLDIPTDDLRIFRSIIESIKVYLPDLNAQIDVVSLNSLILDMETRINHYRKNLWKSPQDISHIQNELNSGDAQQSEARFEQWLETLPYPLASILWASITNTQNERKVKYLLHFFEAFSEFIFTVLLSGLSANKSFYEKEVKNCNLDETQFRNWYYKPTFGNWYNKGSCLAKRVRQLLENNTKKKKCLELFGNPEPEFLHKIAKKELFDIFHEVSNYRNQWEGHGPIVSEEGYKNRLKILRNNLSRVYNILEDSFENSFLVLPVQSSFKEGVHDYTVKKFMSTRPPFKPINIETVKLMDKTKIYLVSKNQMYPLELLPFIIVKNEICYYYNGRDYESKKARYVSYYHSEEAEILVHKNKIEPFLPLLEPKEDYY